MAESRLQRWARKKAETRQEAPPASEPQVQDTGVAVETGQVEQELAINEQLSEQEILTKYNLPNPDALEQGTDITGFLRKEIPELLRRKALRALWRSNPIFGVLDRLNEYDEDYSKANIPIGGVKTAYKVGKGGFLDLEKRERERQERALEGEPTTDTVRLSDPAQPEEFVSVEQEREAPEPELPDPEIEATTSVDQTDVPPTYVSAEVESDNSTPRFRPRMQFEGS